MTGLAVAGSLPRRWAGAAVLAGGLVAACVAAVVAGLVLGETPRDSGYLVVDVTQGLVFPAVALVVVTARPRHAAGWLLLVVGAGHAGSVLAGGWHAADAPGAVPALWVESWIWFVGLAALVALVPVVVPDGIPQGRRRWLWRVGVTVGTATTVAMALVNRLDTGPHTGIPNPLAVPGADAAAGILLACCALCTVVALGDLVLRWLRADEQDRRRLLPVVSAYLLVGGGLLLATALPADEPVIQALTLPWVAVGIAVAVLRYHLFDIELVLRRTLTYAVVTALLLGVYLAVVLVADALLADRARLAGTVLATGIVAVAFSPVRGAVQRAVGRRLFGERDDPSLALSRLVARLQTTAGPGEALVGVAETVAASLRLPYTALTARDGRLLAAAGVRPSGPLVDFPMAGAQPGDRDEGLLQVAERTPGEAFSQADRALLGELARACAVAVRADRLGLEVQRSRERLVAAREEERRRLRRDLHDEIGPGLAGIRIQLDVVSALLETRPAAAPAVVDEVRGSAGRLVHDLRQLIAGLRPPALDDLGLLDAVRDLAGRLATASVRVHVSGELPAALPAAVEVAAFRIAAEALNNAVRHSGAGRVEVTFTGTTDALVVAVRDDGRGLPSVPLEGVGLPSMRERATELGGTLELVSQRPSGLLVRARIPVGPT